MDERKIVRHTFTEPRDYDGPRGVIRRLNPDGIRVPHRKSDEEIFGGVDDPKRNENDVGATAPRS